MSQSYVNISISITLCHLKLLKLKWSRVSVPICTYISKICHIFLSLIGKYRLYQSRALDGSSSTKKGKGATSQKVSGQAHGLCVFLARVDTTRPWSKQLPDSRLRCSAICQFPDLLVSVANGTSGNYPPCIDEEGLQWLHKKGITHDRYRSNIK